MLVEHLDELHDMAERAGRSLATERTVPDEVEGAVARISEAREDTPDSELAALDPYLVLALDRGLLAAWRGLGQSGGGQRAAVRVAVEQVRQALRDLRAEEPIGDTRPAKELAQWLDEVLDASRADVASLLGVSPRQYQRWISRTDAAEPHGEDARRLRVLARLVAHLRHAWTGPGVVAWLTHPHPALNGRTPSSLLDDVEHYPQLRRLASSMRSTRAA